MRKNNSAEPLNYLTAENGVIVTNCTSQIGNCPCKNVLVTDKKAIWLSDQGLPQSFILNMSNQINRPKFYKCFGFYCWHDYPSNPSVIELLAATDGENYITWTVIRAELKAGVQLFSIDPLATRYNFLKIVVKETFGASKTYFNQIFLFEENPMSNFQNGVSSVNNQFFKSDESPQEGLKTNFDSTNQTYARDHASLKNNRLDSYEKDSKPAQREAKTLNHPHQEQIGSGHQYPTALINNQSKSRLDEIGSSLHQPNFENNTGNFFSPPPEHYFSNTNLSLINETDKKSQTLNDENQLKGKIQSNNYKHFSEGKQHKDSNVIQAENLSNIKFHTISNTAASFKNNQNNEWKTKQNAMDNDTDISDSEKKQYNKYKHTANHRKIEDNEDVEENINFPMMTRSEKDVYRMKIDMEKWGAVINSLQGDMSKVLEKVSSMSQNIQIKQTDLKDKKQEQKSNLIQGDAFNERTNLESQSLNNNHILGDYLEDFKKNITSYLDNVVSQNQIILEENYKLRQNLDGLVQSHGFTTRSPSENLKTHAELSDQKYSVITQEAEKEIVALFQKHTKIWENKLYNYIQSQIDVMQDKVMNKVDNTFETIKDYEQDFREMLLVEIGHLQNQMKSLKFVHSSPVKVDRFNSLTDRIKTQREYNKSDSLKHKFIEKPSNVTFTTRENNEISPKFHGKKPYNGETHRYNELIRNDRHAAATNTTNVQKVQYLMDKLQEKIALRDEKVQALQRDFSISSPSIYRDDFTSNDEERGRILFSHENIYMLPTKELSGIIEYIQSSHVNTFKNDITLHAQTYYSNQY